MRADTDPKPQNAIGHTKTKCAVGYADAYRSEISNIFEVSEG
jgi:hypothetical protein